jgi:hypothetical protein
MNSNYLSMMAQRFPQGGQAQQPRLMQMLMAKRQQMQQPQASIMPMGQPMQQIQTIAQPPMQRGNRLMPKGMQSY